MKVAPRAADAFLRAPDPDVRAILLFGPDAGLARERAEALVRLVAEDPADPFRVTELSAGDLADDPARLADEAAALSLTGGRRVVRVRAANETVTPLLAGFVEAPVGEALVVVEAGDLSSRSGLRKAFEGARRAAAVACYRDDARDLESLVRAVLRAHGLSVAPDALSFLVDSLGGDRQVTRREIEKLALYKGPDGGQVELDDARACVGDSAALSLEDLAFAVADGGMAGLERALARSFQEGAAPVSALRAVARHFQRLHLVAALCAQGTPYEQAVRRLRPPVFWKVKDRFRAQAATWPPGALARALDRLLEAERACKRTGAPDEVLCARALLEIAANAPRRPGRPAA